jgi:hypothetical protein
MHTNLYRKSMSWACLNFARWKAADAKLLCTLNSYYSFTHAFTLTFIPACLKPSSCSGTPTLELSRQFRPTRPLYIRSCFDSHWNESCCTQLIRGIHRSATNSIQAVCSKFFHRLHALTRPAVSMLPCSKLRHVAYVNSFGRGTSGSCTPAAATGCHACSLRL